MERVMPIFGSVSVPSRSKKMVFMRDFLARTSSHRQWACGEKRLSHSSLELTNSNRAASSPLPKGEVDLLLAMRSIVQCKSGEGLQSLMSAAASHPDAATLVYIASRGA